MNVVVDRLLAFVDENDLPKPLADRCVRNRGIRARACVRAPVGGWACVCACTRECAPLCVWAHA